MSQSSLNALSNRPATPANVTVEELTKDQGQSPADLSSQSKAFIEGKEEPKTEKTTGFMLYIPNALKEELTAMAKKKSLTRNAFIVSCIVDSLERMKN